MTANANTAAFTSIALARDRPGGAMAISQRRPAPAIAMPRMPPMMASRTLSVISWRTSRLGAAPSAARIAISVRRAAPRASSRFVTLTQAMTRTSVTAASTATSAGRTPAVTSSCSEVVMNPCASDAHGTLGNSAAGSRAIEASSSCARSIVAPERTTSHHSQVMSPGGAQRHVVLKAAPTAPLTARGHSRASAA